MINIQSDYFQKSKYFLYPLTGIKGNSLFTPEMTYTYSTINNIKIEDKKLITVYKVNNWDSFSFFYNNNLKNQVCYKNEKECVAIFDFKECLDWDYFIQGKYSKYNKENKEKIKKYFDKTPVIQRVKSIITPEYYHKKASENLLVDEELIKEVNELCDLPNLNLENYVEPLGDRY